MVTPYYNKPTQEGMYLHCRRSPMADLPMIIIYNIPPRSVVDMSVGDDGAAGEAQEHRRRKDATANLDAAAAAHAASLPRRFRQLSGEDHTALPFNAAGGVGCISVSANVAPRLVAGDAGCVDGRAVR